MNQSRSSVVQMVFAALALILIMALPPAYRFSKGIPQLYAAYLFTLAFLISFILTNLCIHCGTRLGFIDHPDGGRKVHACPTPLTGGVSIVAALLITIAVNFHFSTEMKAILAGALMIFLVGLIDDRWGVSAGIRLLVQLAAAALVIRFGVAITFIPDSLGGIFVEIPLTIIWLLGITNAMNFIDGMDGIASGTSIIQSLFFAIIAYQSHQTYMMFLAVALAGSCAGFLPHNFRLQKNARIFLGSNGSTFLGFLLACIALLGEWGNTIMDLIVPVLIMSVLIFDQSLTTLLRILRGEVRTFSEWINFTGRDHFHHQLKFIFKSKVLAFFVYHGVSVCFGLAALAILFSEVRIGIIVLLHSILAFVILGMILVFGNPYDSRGKDKNGTAGNSP